MTTWYYRKRRLIISLYGQWLGYTLEADLEYPTELHDDHNCYPLAPEHKIVHDKELAPYSQQ